MLRLLRIAERYHTDNKTIALYGYSVAKRDGCEWLQWTNVGVLARAARKDGWEYGPIFERIWSPPVGGGEKGYQFGGRDGAVCGVTLWPAVGRRNGEEATASSLRPNCPRF
jgi:hypothetical protein